ncbi:hypothetical protein BKA65DRAFT_550458 [Rhexocercosporidium sp. MPI-PUGE-AT-0058]|nr:hypothetical protein BKA65DRAFT_550458 [Rhexocercosporidium sp. MPI-PUGE-AT-0058]
MSFGWSTGDVASAIKITYNLIQALDSIDGSASDYREAVAFLRDLKRTLEPLQTYTAWNAYPVYGNDIKEQVECIREPVEQFLASLLKYEPSLRDNARKGHHRHVLRKLQWYMLMSKKVLGLRKKIESHMRVLDTLMQRLTLDVVLRTQESLPENLRTTLQETLRPEFVSVLRESLAPLHGSLLKVSADPIQMREDTTIRTIAETCIDLSLEMRRIQHGISLISNASKVGHSMSQKHLSLTSNLHSTHPEDQADGQVIQPKVNKHPHEANQNTIRQVYYLVFLYLGCFLKNMFLALSQSIKPSVSLMPTLLAKYNISFLDAIGRPPRILPYEYFRSFKVLQAFIQHEFKTLPGSAWVDQGRYMILSLANYKALGEENWSSSVAPGSVVSMSMVVRRRLASSLSLARESCPEPSCPGTWVRSDAQSWATCPTCDKIVLNSEKIATNFGQDARVSSHESQGIQRSTSGSQSLSQPVPWRQLLDDDISVFKRVVQERLSRNEESDSSIISPFTICPRSQYSVGHSDWMTFTQCPSLDICPSCFASTIEPTELGKLAVQSSASAEDEVLCDFGGCAWYRIAWIFNIKDGREILQLFQDLSTIVAKYPACSGPSKVVQEWYTILNPRTGTLLNNFSICYSCARSILVLLPVTKGLFLWDMTQKMSGVPKACKMHFRSKDFGRYFDAIEDFAESVAISSTSNGCAQKLADAICRIASVEECPQATPSSNRCWHIIPQVDGFFVCEECFNELVRPGIEEGKLIPMMFHRTTYNIALATCQLRTQQMRDIFEMAVEQNDYGLLSRATNAIDIDAKRSQSSG